MSAIAVVVVGAVFGGIVQTIFAARDRARDGRASALIVSNALTEALVQHSKSKGQPFKPVYIDYGAYADVWQTERKALAQVMARDSFTDVAVAFAALRVLGKKDASGYDLSNDVFDSMDQAGMTCEHARRALNRYTYSRWERAKDRAGAMPKTVKQRVEFRRMNREWRAARDAEDGPDAGRSEP